MSAPETRTVVRRRLVVRGVVQGVGFRPHVAALASDLGLDGWCHNDSGAVEVEVEGHDRGRVRGLVFRKVVPALTPVRRLLPPGTGSRPPW